MSKQERKEVSGLQEFVAGLQGICQRRDMGVTGELGHRVQVYRLRYGEM